MLLVGLASPWFSRFIPGGASQEPLLPVQPYSDEVDFGAGRAIVAWGWRGMLVSLLVCLCGGSEKGTRERGAHSLFFTLRFSNYPQRASA